MSKQLGGIANLNRLPSAVFIVDIHHEHLALAEARKLGIKTVGMVDTNSDPTLVDYPSPAMTTLPRLSRSSPTTSRKPSAKAWKNAKP
jgi:ribosomal protein S2